MKKEKKNQFIALCADRKEDALQLLPTVQTLSEKLKKGIIIFTCSPNGEEWVDKLGLPYAALKSNWNDAVEAMPTVFNVILAVALYDHDASSGSLSNPRYLLKCFNQSKVAYLAVPKTTCQFNPRNVALTLDHQRESKEKLLWASYMARFCGSAIHVYHLPYSDEDFRRRLKNNIQYLDKIFSSLSIEYQLHATSNGNQYTNPDLKTLTHADCDMYIALVADKRDRDFLDMIFPPDSLRLLRRADTKPILFLNQRDDLYVMCD